MAFEKRINNLHQHVHPQTLAFRLFKIDRDKNIQQQQKKAPTK